MLHPLFNKYSIYSLLRSLAHATLYSYSGSLFFFQIFRHFYFASIKFFWLISFHADHFVSSNPSYKYSLFTLFFKSIISIFCAAIIFSKLVICDTIAQLHTINPHIAPNINPIVNHILETTFQRIT